MKPQERIAQLEQELAAATNRIHELESKIASAPSPKVSRGMEQALAVQALLENGPVTVAQLAELNPKYPTDVVYNARTLLKLDVVTVRKPGGGTFYMLRKQYEVWQEGLKKEASAKTVIPTVQAEAPKEAVPPAAA